MNKIKYKEIKDKYEFWSSWAVWSEQDGAVKSNVGNLDVFDLSKNPKILDILNPNIIFVGLNISRGDIRDSFANFHSSNPRATDFKLRYAIKDTPAWGGYMTDIIKDYEEVLSNNVISYLKKNPDFVEKNIRIFIEEMIDIGANSPILIAFGDEVYKILERYFFDNHKIIKVPHYAATTNGLSNKEIYREVFIDCINKYIK